MSDRFNCRIHGLQFVDNYNNGCPRCQLAEEDAARDRQEIKRSLGEDAYRRANPGDYDCPQCMYRSLKWQASRCPLCQGEIVREYWSAVAAMELAKAEREAVAARERAERQRELETAAAAEYLRSAPERAAAAERAAVAAANAAAEVRRQRRYIATGRKTGAGFSYGGMLGGILMGVSGCVSCLNNYRAEHTVLTHFNLFNGLIYGAVGGAVIGALLGYALSQSEV